MRIIDKINEFKLKYNKSECGIRDSAVLYGLQTPSPPLATHIVFSPMPQNVKEYMVSNYKLPFPKDLLDMYDYMNGADLFWTTFVLPKSNRRIPISRLRIYGIPLTNDRKHLEPLNISIEDLGRPKESPKNWLKFGSFYYPDNLLKKIDLFVDVESLNVFAVDSEETVCSVVDNWKSIDECLCNLFDILST